MRLVLNLIKHKTNNQFKMEHQSLKNEENGFTYRRMEWTAINNVQFVVTVCNKLQSNVITKRCRRVCILNLIRISVTILLTCYGRASIQMDVHLNEFANVLLYSIAF